MSFKIVCNECGTEVVFRNDFEGVTIEDMVYIYSTMDGRVIIECVECGNDIISR